MSSAAKARGTRWETAILRHIRANLDPAAYKPRQEGFNDVGDIHAAGIVWQAKDWRSWQDAIREGLDGAVKQAGNAGRRFGVAVVKRARRPVGEAYAVMRLDDLLALMGGPIHRPSLVLELPPGRSVYCLACSEPWPCSAVAE